MSVLHLEESDWTNAERWEALVNDEDHDYYWSDNWSPAFYVGQARAGFIAVGHVQDGLAYLLPQLQTSYSVLDWPDLHEGRNFRRLLRRSVEADEPLQLFWNPDPIPVLDAIRLCYGRHCWLIPRYRQLLAELALRPFGGFQVWGVELRRSGALVAGELGYTLGATYTSLSGFVRADLPGTSGLGTVQLVLLGRHLRDRGYDFWNLGQPEMAYKTALGGRVWPRRAFLDRWNAAAGSGTGLRP